ncbi:peptidylprolyl isomerase [bacterium]|nr:peptidylprolyl isomerase [bacterium]
MKKWLIVVVLLAAMVVSYNWLANTQIKPTIEEAVKPPPQVPQKKATMTPGRVVELHTTKGEIDFVLFEKDCPKSTKRIADLAKEGSYNGVKFERVVPNLLIQTALAKTKKPINTIPRELADGLTNTKGAVGMARKKPVNSAVSVFYILIEPMPHLDYDYAVFGRVIRGMDVITSIKKNDTIKYAKVRPMTGADRKAFGKVLEIESERRVN